MFYSGISLGVDHSKSRFTNPVSRVVSSSRQISGIRRHLAFPAGVSSHPVTSLNAAGEGRDMQEWITYGILAALLMLFSSSIS